MVGLELRGANSDEDSDMAYIMVDVEADGPIPGDYSMVCFGAIVVEPSLDRTFCGRLKPISDKWIPEALKASGFTREETLEFDDPKTVMQRFADWLAEIGGGRQPMFISDNNGFDWQFIKTLAPLPQKQKKAQKTGFGATIPGLAATIPRFRRSAGYGSSAGVWWFPTGR
jgi:hypothetical protein